MRFLLSYARDVTLSQSFLPMPPLGIMYLAAVLERDGHWVRIVDLSVDKQDVFNSYAKKVDVLGVSVPTQLLSGARALVQEAKKLSPKIKVIVGGPHPSSLCADTFTHIPEADFIAVGEGEETIKEFANEVEYAKIDGLIWKDEDGKIYENNPRTFIKDLDTLPLPARHLVSMNKYSMKGSILTSRGCPFRCVYCYKWSGRTYRAHSPRYVLEEMEDMQRRYGVKSFHVVDDNFTAIPKRAEEIVEGIMDRNWRIGLSLFNGIRADFIARNEALIAKMKKAGLKYVSVGAESVIQDVLDATKKDLKVGDIEKAVRILKDNKIDFILYLMVGLPGDRFDNVQRTIDWLKKNEVSKFSVSLTTPYPKTKLWNYINENENGRWLKPVHHLFDNVRDHLSIEPLWDTTDFPAEQRVEAMMKYMRFYNSQRRIIGLALRHPKLAYLRLKRLYRFSQIKKKFRRRTLIKDEPN